MPWLCALCLAVWTLSAPLAPGAPTESSATAMIVGDAASDPAFDELAEAIAAHLSGGAVQAVVRPTPVGSTRAAMARELAKREPVVAVYWMLRDDSGYAIFAFDPRREAYLRRDVPFGVGEEAAAIEAVALIVDTTAEALWAGEVVALNEVSEAEVEEAEAAVQASDEAAARTTAPGDAPESDSPAAAPPPPSVLPEPTTASPSAAPRRRPSLALAAHYEAETLAQAHPWVSGFGLSATVARRRLVLGLDYSGYLERDLDVDLATAPGGGSRFVRHRLGALVGLRFQPRAWLTLLAPLVPSLELVRWTHAGRARTRPVARIEAALRARFRVVGGWFVQLDTTLVAVLNNVDFVLCAENSSCEGPDRRVILDPWPVRGRLGLGVGVRF